MKHILISIRPEHCYNILNKNKILEIRTTCPAEWKKYLDGKTNIKPQPCKVYIYCTKDNKNYLNRKDCRFCYIEKRDLLGITDKVRELFDNLDGFYERLNGKVIAEFTLNEIDKIEICDPYIFRNNKQEDWKYFENNACLTREQMMKYIGYDEDHDGWDKKYDTGYAWHIDDLIDYDKPKELDTFIIDKVALDCGYGNYNIYNKVLKRPPQSWCYVLQEGE